MSPEIVGIILAALFGGGGIAALVSAVLSKRQLDASAMATWSTVWNENLDMLRTEVNTLRDRVTVLEAELMAEQERNRVLTTLLIEHRIDLP